MFEIIKTNWSELSLAVGGVVAYFGGRKTKNVQLKKEIQDLKSSESSNVARNMEIYQELLDDMQNRFKAQVQDIELIFEKKVEALQEEISRLTTVVDEFKERLSKYE